MATLAEWKTNLKNSHSTLSKMVDGVSITLTSAEYKKTIDEWAEASYVQQVENDIIANGGESANYAQYRADAYPSIADQLDMQYHDSVNGTTTWADAITAVKAKYAKP